MTGAYTFDSAAVHARLGLLADLAAVRRGMMLLPEGGGDTQQRLQLAGEASRLLRALRETAPATPADQQLDSAGTDRSALLAELRRAMDALAAADDPVVRLDLLAEVARLRKALGDGAGASVEPEPEPADDPDAFVEAPGGGLDFGEITAEMAQAAGRQPGRIRLQVGSASWGMMHIEQRHGAEIRGAGFASAAAFVADVARHIDQVWKPATTRQLVVLHKAGNNLMMFVELQPGRDEAGDFYTVNTAFASRKAGKKGWKLLWEARAQASGDSGNRPTFAEPPQ